MLPTRKSTTDILYVIIIRDDALAFYLLEFLTATDRYKHPVKICQLKSTAKVQ